MKPLKYFIALNKLFMTDWSGQFEICGRLPIHKVAKQLGFHSKLTMRRHILYRGDIMDKAATCYDSAMRDFEIELMLLVNERLYQKGGITTEIYIKAKEQILKS